MACATARELTPSASPQPHPKMNMTPPVKSNAVAESHRPTTSSPIPSAAPMTPHATNPLKPISETARAARLGRTGSETTKQAAPPSTAAIGSAMRLSSPSSGSMTQVRTANVTAHAATTQPIPIPEYFSFPVTASPSSVFDRPVTRCCPQLRPGTPQSGFPERGPTCAECIRLIATESAIRDPVKRTTPPITTKRPTQTVESCRPVPRAAARASAELSPATVVAVSLLTGHGLHRTRPHQTRSSTSRRGTRVGTQAGAAGRPAGVPDELVTSDHPTILAGTRTR